MKICNQDIQQLIFFKTLALNNRLQQLIQNQDEPYPPRQHTVNQIYSSQYATALHTIKEEGLIHPTNQSNHDNAQKSKPPASPKHHFKHPTHHPSVKYPLPLAFAYFQAYQQENLHQKSIKVLKNHLQKTNIINQHIVNYNISYLYRERQDSKKAIFYLESVLKEKPFFEYGVIDYAFLLSMNNRTPQALQFLKRHITNSSNNFNSRSPLVQSSSAQSMFLSLAFQTRTISERQILKIFSNKQLSIQTCFNLGLYLKKTKVYFKAENIFTLLIQKLDHIYKSRKQSSPNFEFKQKDQKVYFYAKINLCQVYEHLAKEQSLEKQNNQTNKESCRAFKYKAYKILDSLLNSSVEETQKYSTLYLKYSQLIKQLMQKLNKEICSQTNNHFFQYNQTQLLKQTKQNSNSKRQVNLSELKKLKNSIKYLDSPVSLLSTGSRNRKKQQRLFKPNQGEKRELQLMKEFNRKFQQRRVENQNKLKFLLLKDKQLDNFFKTLPKINFERHQNSILTSKDQNSVTFNNSRNKKTKDQNTSLLKSKVNPLVYPQNQTLIKKLRKQLQEENILSKLQDDFQRKKLKYQQEFEGYNLDEALEKIMEKIFNDPTKKQTSLNPIQKKNHFQSPAKKGQNFLVNQQAKPSQCPIKMSFGQIKNHDTKIERQFTAFSNRSQQKKLTIQRSILKSNLTHRQKSVQGRFGQDLNQLSKNQSKKQLKNYLSERKPKRQISTSGNFRIKASLGRQNEQNQNQPRKQRQQKIEKCLKTPEDKKGIVQRQKQNSVRFIETVNQINDSNKEVLKNSNENSERTLNTQKIFVEKDTSNIEDIFESFNPKSHRNILINKSAPSSKNISKRASTQLSLNIFGFGLADQLSESNKLIPSEYQNKYNQASQLENAGKYLQAFDVYTELYKEFKQNHLKQMTLLGIAYNFEIQKQIDQAEKTYLKCCNYNNAESFMRLGQLLIRSNRIDEGIQNLQKANCIKRFDKEIQTKLVYGYSLKEQTIDKALSLAHLVLKREPMSLEILIMTANILQKQSKIKEALEISLAIDSHKESEFIKHYIGTLYLAEGNVVEAFKYFKSALQIKSNHVPSLIEIGTILSELKPKEAISILNKALEIQPNNRLALARLAKIYESIEQNPEKAMEIYKKTLQTKSNYEAYMKIGNCLEMNGSYLEALVNYRQALNLKKTHHAFMKIAQMHEHKKQYKRSIDNYQLALELLSKDHKFQDQKKNILLNMAKNMLILQEFDNAINTLLDLLELEESKQIYSMLGQGYFGKQEFSIALEFYQKANDIEPEKDDVEILEYLALCFDKKEEFTASRRIYEKILQLDPHNIKCINNYANILLIIGNTNEAFYWFQVMLQYCPKNIQKRLKVADIYSAVGDWSKVEYHLLICYKQKEHDVKVLEKLINLYKEKREAKMVAKFQKKITLLKANNKKKEH